MSLSSSIRNLRPDLEALLRETGEFVAAEFQRFSYDQVQYKAENDPFTYVDVQAEVRLREGCEQLLPESGFINEEAEDRPSKNGYEWIIDPIDGTSNFTHGVPHFCISLALAYERELILGYVYQPITGMLFSAFKGEGAFCNGEPIQASQRKDLNLGLVGTGFPYANFPEREAYFRMLMAIKDRAHGLRRQGSAALDLAYVAWGRYDGFLEVNLKPYDVAAGILLVQEAGGQVSDFTGGDQYLFGRQIIVSNGFVHQDLLEVVREHLPPSWEVAGNM
ncbi:MAG: inositol monophosphatase family protein [Bacteroidota bacterium]